MAKVARGEGFSLLWRLGWNIEYTLLHAVGPATLDDARDPRVAMERDYERRKALHLARTSPPSAVAAD
ncbi:MAG: hypothetical protein JWP61_1523 [Friedmanniella sp.]|jgi:hypothetical protein|nr:hypothetical protein [Friedmanniella sp.]